MAKSRSLIEKQLYQLQKGLEEINKTEADLTEKAGRTAAILKAALPALPADLTSEQMLVYLNAITHLEHLAEDKTPFHEISSKNLENLESIAAIFSQVDARMGSASENTTFKKRARSIIWLTLNYEDLSKIVTRMGLLTEYPMLNADLISANQRLMKFSLFADQLQGALNALPAESISLAAKKAMENFLLRANGIAAMTDTLMLSIDPRTGKPLIKSCHENFINSIISKMVAGVLQEQPNKNYMDLMREIKGEIQKEMAISLKSSESKKLSDGLSMWQEKSTTVADTKAAKPPESKEFKKK